MTLFQREIRVVTKNPRSAYINERERRANQLMPRTRHVHRSDGLHRTAHDESWIARVDHMQRHGSATPNAQSLENPMNKLQINNYHRAHDVWLEYRVDIDNSSLIDCHHTTWGWGAYVVARLLFL